ncbi:MAG: hypothetical protein Q4F79_00195 [Eubacteriales bacterium]|nr:hypothetical protein [Eubacteriales bacterium]
MSKIIKMTSQNLDEIRKDFEEALKGLKLSDGRINFTKTFGTIQRKATLYFTELAYLKMLTLVREFDKEVAWHGIAKRCEDEEDAYIISDILVYPQEVTGATVNTDQEKYQMWLMNNDDEVFNNIRMQGHSHVNMGTTPSSVDTNLYDQILAQLEDDMFYIFLIWNKRNEKTIKIYDLAKNVLFETADVTVKVREDDIGMERFLKDAKEMVQDKKYTPTTPPYGKPYGYGGYYGTYNKTGSNSVTEKKEESEKKTQTETTGMSGGVHTSSKKKKKKKKQQEDTGFQRRNGSYWDGYYDDDDYMGRYGYR